MLEPDGTTFVPCDSCGKWSYVYVTLESGGELSYCGHHWTEYAEGLRKVAKRIVDMRHLLDVSN